MHPTSGYTNNANAESLSVPKGMIYAVADAMLKPCNVVIEYVLWMCHVQKL